MVLLYLVNISFSFWNKKLATSSPSIYRDLHVLENRVSRGVPVLAIPVILKSPQSDFHCINVREFDLQGNYRCFMYLYLNWIKSYNIKSVKKFFFSCLKMHYFRAILPKWVLAPPKETSSHSFKMAIFPKFFGAFMKHIIR